MPETTSPEPTGRAQPHAERVRAAAEHLAAVLRAVAGPDAEARDGQDAAVAALVADDAHVLVVQATGWGKSAVYWAATAAIRALGGGPTLVVSPLLALMRDQIAAAERAGLRAATINSTNVEEWDATLAAIDAGTVDVLLVSPERLANPSFARRVRSLVAGAGLVVIDEAHCISDWGFDFRPDYQRLSRVLTGAPGVPVLATTATANARVTADVAAQLGESTLVLRGSLARASLRLSVVDGLGALERYAWVDEALEALPGSGIVYVPTVAETERLAGWLSSRGHAVAAYSGQLDPQTRAQVEDALRVDALKAVVATSALGMGYDKPDLGFCVHVGSPDSPVAYYQQIGRAGRAIETAEVVLLPAESDERLWEYFATASVPDPKQVRRVLDVLGDVGEPVTVPALEAATGIRRGRLEALLRVVAVDGAVERTASGWVTTGVPYVFDAAKWADVRAVRAAEADLMRAYARGRGCLMEFLRRALDDPDPGPCGSCSVCTGRLPAPGATPDPARVDAARVHLRGADTVLDPRKRWPTGLDGGPKGVIHGAAEGRALTFADTPGWAEAAAAVTGPDRPLPDDVVAGLVAVLGRWRATWPARPVAVVPMPSRRHPGLVRDLAERIATVGKLPLLDALVASGPPPPDDVPSASRVRALLAGLTVHPDLELPADGPLLLVDDTYRTGWTMTVGAARLREAGATAVMPLVVHQLP